MALHHVRGGRGKPLALIHGLGGSLTVWGPVLERLEAERETIAVDLPGFGHSPPLAPGTRPTPANLARAVGELCRELDVERPHVGGISLGGWVALELAKLGAAASVCAFSPAGLWPAARGTRRFERHRLARAASPVLHALLATRRGQALLLRTTAEHPERIPPTAAREIVTGWLDSPGYTTTNREMRSACFEGEVAAGVPVTVAWGANDRQLRRPQPEQLPPGARYLVLPGCGHVPTWDDPDRVAAVLLEASSERGG